MPVTDSAPPVTKFPPVTLPVATTRPAVPMLPIFALPVTDNTPLAPFARLIFAVALPTINPVSKPTLVRLDVTTVEFNVVPVNVPAGATTVLPAAAVNWP